MILCFATHKGGTGKTTSSINTAAGLARAGHRTLLIDLDAQGHASMGLGMELDYDEPTIADVLAGPTTPLSKIVHPTAVERLWVAPSNIRLAAVAEGLYAKVRREERLAKSITQGARAYDWIVIDCPPALGVLTANAVNASDVIVVPVPMGARALDGLEDLLELVHLLKGERFGAWWILSTMYDARKSVTLEIFGERLEPFADKILTTRIHVSEALNQAQMAGQDIYAFDSRSRGAGDYEALTREILTRYRD